MEEGSDGEKDGDDNEDDDDQDEDDSDDDLPEEELMLDPDTCCDIVLQVSVKKGQEIYNTYGDLSNPMLLARYGFAVHNNPHDYVSLGKQILRYKKARPETEERLQWWTDSGHSIFCEFVKSLIKEQQPAHVQGAGCGDGWCEEDSCCQDEHGEHSGHDEHGCCDDDECQDDCCNNDEMSWLLSARIEHPGAPSHFVYALAKLVTLSEEDFKTIVEDTSESHIKKYLVKSTKVADKVLLQWCQERYDDYVYLKDLNSKQIEELSVRTSETSTDRVIDILIQNEKAILEKCMSSFEKL
ncbi:unnamed protein product [Ambrosiozyma monospora]|uniref:Unnamed protein product n=1 Tax=Ambrosiozyma monospora TaxID=43982 RepID=A0A9W6Z342_AMBMO|nr:unnamed protein product [Ambrosiozyma monospora]